MTNNQGNLRNLTNPGAEQAAQQVNPQERMSQLVQAQMQLAQGLEQQKQQYVNKYLNVALQAALNMLRNTDGTLEEIWGSAWDFCDRFRKSESEKGVALAASFEADPNVVSQINKLKEEMDSIMAGMGVTSPEAKPDGEPQAPEAA